MDRRMMDTLLTWRSASEKTGLVISGTRQVGKTFIVDELGRNHYTHYLRLDFSTDPEAGRLFEDDIDADSIFRKLLCRFPEFRVEKGDSLLFLDEIQLCPDARSSIKPLVVDGRVDVIASSSLVGTGWMGHSDKRGLPWAGHPENLIRETVSEGKKPSL